MTQDSNILKSNLLSELLSVHRCSLRMLKIVLLLMTLPGLQAVPVAAPRGLPETSSTYQLPDGFQQGNEPILDGFRQGTVTGEMERRQWLTDEGHVDVPAQKSGGGWVRVEEASAPHLPDGFRQGTEPFMPIRDGFRQGTAPFMPIRDGFRQGPEPFMPIRDGFTQGTEPFMPIRDGFRQGTGTSTSWIQTVACKGEDISGNCYEFNPTPLTFQDAQVLCRALAPNAELASVTSGDLHYHLVSLVTKGGESSPVLTWLGGMVKNQQTSWVDGSEWSYSDWMPGHPNKHTNKLVCVEMFKMDESWTAADCDLKRASICSYPITA
uniref:C-type lectin domain-containing protein n=1 Tax=Monopterus albus TaxID=43700 RepID=A0A3Q3J6N2_MONAL|nr:uncharacterized protein LOC109955590 [Monopterus albus]